VKSQGLSIPQFNGSPAANAALDEFRKLWPIERGDEAVLWRREQLVEIKLDVQRKVRENPYRPPMPGAREELERRLDALAERRRRRVGSE
jgi:hypothetical protein